MFDSDSGVFGPGSYTLDVSIPHSFYQIDFVAGWAIDRLGPAGSNIFYSAQNRLFSADNSGTHAVLASPVSLSGSVYLDANNNGVIDSGERPIAGVKVTATNGSTTQSVVSDAYGIYTFDNLPAGTYTITETQPGDYADGKDTLGNKGGTMANNKFSGIVLAAGASGSGYNFGEQQTVGSAFTGNQTQTIAWWNGSTGQSLIKTLNGGQTAKNLGNWLAATFNNLYGADAGSANNLANKTNAQVAAYYQALFSNTAQGRSRHHGSGPGRLCNQFQFGWNGRNVLRFCRLDDRAWRRDRQCGCEWGCLWHQRQHRHDDCGASVADERPCSQGSLVGREW